MDKKPLQDVYDDDRGFWDKFSRPYGSKGAPVTPYQELRGQHSSTATPVRNRDTTKISSTKELNAIVNNTEKTVKILERVASTLLSVSTSMDEVKKALGNVSRVASSESSDRKSTRLNSSHITRSRMPSSA